MSKSLLFSLFFFLFWEIAKNQVNNYTSNLNLNNLNNALLFNITSSFQQNNSNTINGVNKEIRNANTGVQVKTTNYSTKTNVIVSDRPLDYNSSIDLVPNLTIIPPIIPSIIP
jgi:hypothetical protein